MSYRNHFRAFSGYDTRFPDPFNDMATKAMPNSFRNAMEWCEYVFMTHGTIRQAMERTISYFITSLEFGDASTDEKDKWRQFLENQLAIYSELQCGLRNRACYGNDFSSVITMFQRWLVCPGKDQKACGSAYPFREIANQPVFKFRWDVGQFEFHATCPVCGYQGRWQVDDKPLKDEKSIKIRHWSPHEIETVHCYYTDTTAYFWRIPEHYRQQVISGNIYHLERVTKPIMSAIKNKMMFRFHEEALFHMKEPTVVGIENRGWGIPRLLTNFRQIWYVQVLHRYNEAIALDYVIPFRLLTPAPRGTGGGGGAIGATQDPLATFHMGDARAAINQMIRQRNRDPAAWHSLPFPVEYQMLGGDANQLAPTDLLDQGQEKLLNDLGTPVDMYKGTLELQVAPTALRLFEATWHHLVHDANTWLRWVVNQCASVLNWEEPNISLRRVTIADDLEKQNLALQLMLSGKMSGTTSFRGIGTDYSEEQRLIGEEAIEQAEMQARIEEEMQQAGFAQQIAKGQQAGGDPAAQGGQPAPAGGDPNAAPAAAPVSDYISQMGPNTPVTPADMMSAAETLAQQLLGLPEGQKDSELRKLKQQNPTLHSIVRAKLDEIRGQARMVGGSQVLQQNFGGGGQPPVA